MFDQGNTGNKELKGRDVNTKTHTCKIAIRVENI